MAALALDPSGNVYVTGASNLPGVYYEYATVKYNSDGQEQWASRYGQADGVFGAGAAIAVDKSGNVYVTGKINNPGMYPDYGTIKYNSAGQQQWVMRYNGPPANASDYAVDIALDGSGNVYVTGSSQRVAFYSDYDYATIKYDSAGQQQWVARYDGLGGEDQARGIAVDGSDNVYVSGTSNGFYATVKYQDRVPRPRLRRRQPQVRQVQRQARRLHQRQRVLLPRQYAPLPRRLQLHRHPLRPSHHALPSVRRPQLLPLLPPLHRLAQAPLLHSHRLRQRRLHQQLLRHHLTPAAQRPRLNANSYCGSNWYPRPRPTPAPRPEPHSPTPTVTGTPSPTTRPTYAA